MLDFTSKLGVSTALLLLPFGLFSQPFNIQSPVDIPIFLSGNYGELRSTHFHAGLDIKTQGEIGHKVHAVADGYISRVKVRSGGYGHAIYITHSNGYTSVYGHLSSYIPELEAWVKEQQYKRKSFEIDKSLKKEQFPVKQGQIIALSGNTGSSGGPHLHFEIRDQNEVPVNGLTFDLPIKDSIAPVFRNLFVYDDFDLNTYTANSRLIIPVVPFSNYYGLKTSVLSHGNIAFGVEAYDYLNGSLNKCGIYSLDFYVNEKKVYAMQIDKVGFDETRYIRSHMDYAEKKLHGKGTHRLFIEPNNHLGIYDRKLGNSIIVPDDSMAYHCKVVAKDAYGNSSELSFDVVPHDTGRERSSGENNLVHLNYKTENVLRDDSMRFAMARGSLYSNKDITITARPTNNDFFSSSFIIGDQLVPVNIYPVLSLRITKNLDDVQPEKLVIARYDTSGKVISEGGRWNNGWITAKVNGFGKYAVIADTLKPVIKPVSFKNKGWYAQGDKLVFKITDDLSGIKTYNGYIDDKWALFEYDAKSNNLFYILDPERLNKSGGLHEVKLYIMDERNNVESFKGSFYY
jgi:hypothetical protein